MLDGLARADAPLPLPQLSPPDTLTPIAVVPPDGLTPPPIKTTSKAKPHDQFAGARAPIQQVQGYGAPGADVSTGEYQYLVEPPGPDKLFNALDSEAEFKDRLEQEWRDNGHKDRLIFPDEEEISTETYVGRAWPQYMEIVEPYFVAHKRLEFQQINYERYGWDFGIIDPPLSAFTFFADVATLPYHAYTDPFRCYDTGAGYCLPGDPVPLLLYPPELSATGALAETAAVLTVFAVFP